MLCQVSVIVSDFGTFFRISLKFLMWSRPFVAFPPSLGTSDDSLCEPQFEKLYNSSMGNTSVRTVLNVNRISLDWFLVTRFCTALGPSARSWFNGAFSVVLFNISISNGIDVITSTWSCRRCRFACGWSSLSLSRWIEVPSCFNLSTMFVQLLLVRCSFDRLSVGGKYGFDFCRSCRLRCLPISYRWLERIIRCRFTIFRAMHCRFDILLLIPIEYLHFWQNCFIFCDFFGCMPRWRCTVIDLLHRSHLCRSNTDANTVSGGSCEESGSIKCVAESSGCRILCHSCEKYSVEFLDRGR